MILGTAYFGAFHLWIFLPPTGIIGSGLAITAALSALFICFRQRDYFRNACDQFAHGVVILDILLEAILIPVHDHHGFYWCALGFASVIVAHRILTDRVGKAEAPTEQFSVFNKLH